MEGAAGESGGGPEAAGDPARVKPVSVWPAIVVPLAAYFGSLLLVWQGVSWLFTLLWTGGIAPPDFEDPRHAAWAQLYGVSIFLLTVAALVGWLALRREPVLPRLLVRRASLRKRWWPVLALGAMAVSTLTGWAVDTLFGGSPQVEAMSRRAGAWGTAAGGGWPAAALGLLSAVVIGPAWEELAFRGFSLGRLLRRWRGTRGAWAAILASSVIFALPHGEPQHVAAAFCAGLYLGAVAWRTGSVLPAFVCHAAVNATWAAMSMGYGWLLREAGGEVGGGAGGGAGGEAGLEAIEPAYAWAAWGLYLALLGAELLGLIGAAVLLVRTRPPPDADARWFGGAPSAASA